MKYDENKFSLFENELRKDISESGIAYSQVESKLFGRISESEKLKELAILKLDEVPSQDMMDQVEQNLFSRIVNYKEYDEPINECIGTHYDLSINQWDRFSSRLEERIKNVESMPNWEQVLMASEPELTDGKWDEVEGSLFKRIETVSSQEPWVLCTKTDEIQAEGIFDRVEEQLAGRITEKSESANWEIVLKADEVLSIGKWEQMEELLFANLDNAQKIKNVAVQPFWHILDNYLRLFTSVKSIASLTILILLAVGSIFYLKNISATVPTLVYQVQGNAVPVENILNKQIEKTYSSVSGSAVSFVNSHGLVELQNGSNVEVEKLTSNAARYRVDFKMQGDISHGKASFLVNPHAKAQSYRVETPDYEIIVKGTYFRVEPDLGSRFTTRVLEGEVKIHSKLFSDTVLKAGQSLVYDLYLKRYRIQDGGTIIQRKEIENIPDVNELMNYKVLTITSSVPDADIRIDGRYFGTAPLSVRQSIGSHRVWVGKEKYSSYDSTVTISESDSAMVLQVNLSEMVTVPVVETISETPKNKRVGSRKSQEPVVEKRTLSPESVEKQLLGSGSLPSSNSDNSYLQAQKSEKNGNWKSAVALYQKVFDDPDASRLRKEDALFSIGKLKAENLADGSDARQVFLTYLALYPEGLFAGETWLRLAELEFKKKPDNAVQYYQKYFDMFPRHPRVAELQNRVGVILLQQRKYDEAITMFKQALSNQVNPDRAEQRNITSNLFKALEAKGDFASADSIKRKYLTNK
jgi:hypothetical protein